jgi:hypothetical protein
VSRYILVVGTGGSSAKARAAEARGSATAGAPAAAAKKPAAHAAEALFHEFEAGDLSTMLNAPASCNACSGRLIEYNVDGPEVAPLNGNWRQKCLACLATDNDTDATVKMQHLVAEFLAHVLLKQHGMPLTKPAK